MGLSIFIGLVNLSHSTQHWNTVSIEKDLLAQWGCFDSPNSVSCQWLLELVNFTTFVNFITFNNFMTISNYIISNKVQWSCTSLTNSVLWSLWCLLSKGLFFCSKSFSRSVAVKVFRFSTSGSISLTICVIGVHLKSHIFLCFQEIKTALYVSQQLLSEILRFVGIPNLHENLVANKLRLNVWAWNFYWKHSKWLKLYVTR